MKKFFLFALCAISSFSAFAEVFNVKSFSALKTQQQKLAYAYNSQPGQQSTATHVSYYFHYAKYRKGFYFNKNQVDQLLNIFYSGNKNLNCDYVRLVAYSYFGIEQVENIIKNNKFSVQSQPIIRYLNELFQQNKYDKAYSLALQTNNYRFLFNVQLQQKNYDKMWQYGKLYLTSQGGTTDFINADKVLAKMFRYKPRTISKEQQIAFIEQLSQMYPIPGTDFTKWKSFMGFLGYKYKALTGKDLFPESK